MKAPEGTLDAKLYVPGPGEQILPYQPRNAFEFETTTLGHRLLATTNADRIEFFKQMLDLFPGPFFITLVIQEPFGGFKLPGRYYGEYGKTRIQIDYFLDYFHDFISFDGFHHLWVSCQRTDGIVVYDQHDMFFIYGKAVQARSLLESRKYGSDLVHVTFKHAHQSRPEIYPGTIELLKYGPWRLANLEIQDVARPEAKTVKNLWLKIRTWWAIKKMKFGQKRKKS